MKIDSIPAFKDNYIWLLSNSAQQAVVVDPGEAAPVIAHLRAQGLSLMAVLITHHHADHQGGVAELLRHWPETVVYAPANEDVPTATHPLFGDETLRLLDETIEVLAVPGHTRGHLAYRCGEAVFCGDTLFGAGCGRLFEGTPDQMYASLQILAALPETTRIYCAHEYTAMNLPFAQAVEPGNAAIAERQLKVSKMRENGQSTVPLLLREELETNPFLRCAEPAVKAKASQQGAVSSAPVDVFAALRAWRNLF